MDDAHVNHHPNEQRNLTGLSWIPVISIGRWVLLGIQVCLLCYVLKGILSGHLQEACNGEASLLSEWVESGVSSKLDFGYKGPAAGCGSMARIGAECEPTG